MRRVTFSRNLTLSLSRTCQCHCKYCSFATRKAHLHDPEEVLATLDRAARRSIKELLILTGERPEVNAEVFRRLRSWGHEDFTAYVVWTCEQALARGLLPHTNLGVLSAEDLVRLREVTASQGLMLESVAERLMETVHAGSPTKHPRRRLETIAAAGELRIPFTSGILVGIGESEQERMASLEALAAIHARHGHIQEVILQNFVPHPRYYGREVADIAQTAAQAYWRTGVLGGGPHEAGREAEPARGADAGRGAAAGREADAVRAERARRVPLPAWANGGAQAGGRPLEVEDMRRLVAHARALMPDVGIQVPPNLADWWPELVAAGASDLGGLSANGDHISPEHPFPSPRQVRRRLAAEGFALTERLCVYPRYIDAEWLSPGVLDTIRQRYWSFIPRRGSGRLRPPFAIRPDLVSGAAAKGREGRRLSREELTAMFAETRPEAIEEMRRAADELRAELAGETVTFVVNRNINVSNVCTVGCAFCGFGQSRRSPDAYEHDERELVRRVREAVAYGASEICMQSGIHPDWTLEHYVRWLRVVKDAASQLGAEIHLHAYSPMEVAHMCDISGLSPAAVFARLKAAGLGSTPGTAAEVLHDGVRQRISPNKLPVARWVQIIEASHAAGLRSTATVMFGHIEEPWELAEHMRILRELQERTGGITELVPLSFIPFQTLLGRTHGVEEISEAENLKHTAVFRLALGRTVRNLQASWVKMGLDAATESLRWGVNDLGGTLMEESISRMAGSQHGTRLEPGELVAAAHRAGRPAAQRTTLYEIRRRYPLARAAVPATA
jgi:FO synthase